MARNRIKRRNFPPSSIHRPVPQPTFARKNRVQRNRRKLKPLAANRLRPTPPNTQIQYSKIPERQRPFVIFVECPHSIIITSARHIFSIPTVDAPRPRSHRLPTTGCGEQPSAPQIAAGTQSTLVSICTRRYSTQAFTTHLHSPPCGTKGLGRAIGCCHSAARTGPSPFLRDALPGTCRQNRFAR
jgi:hypothetical protein